MSKKYTYLFSEGNGKMRELLGGKGANLAEMTNLGLPVPQGFTISTEACTQYYEDGRKINDEIKAQIMEYIGKMEEITGKKFGSIENPLLVSVRSGARASMPGMMDTILNLGLNEEVVEVMAARSGNARWAYDCYRRFIQMYSDVVMEVGKKYFEELIDKMKEEKGVKQDVELSAADIFRPHTYSRTASLWRFFISALCKADFTILLDIYPAREKAIDGITSQNLAKFIPGAVAASESEAAEIALSHPSRVIALLGAGDVEAVKGDLIALSKKHV